MFVKIISVGKLKYDTFEKLAKDYLKRLSSWKVEVIEVKESKTKNVELKIKEEAEVLEKQMNEAANAGYFTVVLDAVGKEMNSEGFFKFVKKIKDFEGGKVCFVVGGAYGLPEEFKNKAQMRLSFGKMTFTHQFVRILLLEQVYRSFMTYEGRQYDY